MSSIAARRARQSIPPLYFGSRSSDSECSLTITFQPSSASLSTIASPATFSDEAGDQVGAYKAVDGSARAAAGARRRRRSRRSPGVDFRKADEHGGLVGNNAGGQYREAIVIDERTQSNGESAAVLGSSRS